METVHNHTGEHHHGHEHNTHIIKGSDKNILMGVLAYLGILVVIPFLVAKDNGFVKFHIKQGLVLLVIEIILWFISETIWILYPVTALLNFGVLVLAIIGIINVVQGTEKQLPLVGKYSSYFKI